MFAVHFKSSPSVSARGLNLSRLRLAAPVVLPLAMLLVLLGFGGALGGWLVRTAPEVEKLAVFSTSLKGRTRNQKHNARLAARSLDNRVIPAYGVFSFNQTVKSWSVDGGYSKALVSYDGELVRAYGGGVCQTSTTLYNAALLAGLPILERHPHVFVPGYIAPGRDAAVAYPGIDLRFRNPFAAPLRIRARVRGDRLEVSILANQSTKTALKSIQKTSASTRNLQRQSLETKSFEARSFEARSFEARSFEARSFEARSLETKNIAEPLSVHIESQVLSVSAPQRLTRVRRNNNGPTTRRAYLHSAGATGYRVVTYRVWSRGKREVRREFLGDDTYPAMNRVLALIRDAP